MKHIRIKTTLKVIAGLAIMLIVAVYFIFRLETFGGSIEGQRLQRVQSSMQFKNGRFENDPPQQNYSFDQFKTMLKNYLGDQVRQPGFEIPVDRLSPSTMTNQVPPGLRAYWFGHASVLVEIGQMRIMTDPVFTEYASPFDFVGPQRFHPVPLELEHMPNIDAIFISHDHFDHLDMQAVQHFAKNGTHFYVGLGVGAHLQHWGVVTEQIHEMDWWQSLPLKSLTIHCTPARHYSGRKSMDNSTLWASWFLQSEEHSVYYSGDTGYAPHFRQIREKIGPVDLTLIKIGAYGDSWLDIHMNPESAIQAHLDLEGKVLLPVHWATFNLSYHAWNEPIQRVLAAAVNNNVLVTTPRVGEKVEIGLAYPNQSWWNLTH